jgi:hypothetical protein
MATTRLMSEPATAGSSVLAVFALETITARAPLSVMIWA